MGARLHVIAGVARGRGLVVPPGARPTAGRVREAMFASVGSVEGQHVLDLYAGSGAIAVEALSRGAAAAVLVERDRDAVAACEANLAATGADDRGRVAQRAVDVFLGGPVAPEAPFALVWCDPPYGTDAAELGAVVAALGAPGWLSADARIVVERGARDDQRARAAGESSLCAGAGAGGDVPDDGVFEVTWERKYGDTLVTVLRSRRRSETEV